MLKFLDDYVNNTLGVVFSKYENILKDPVIFMEKFCKAYGLGSGRYPYDQIENIVVRGSSTLRKKDNKNVTWDAMSKSNNFKTTGYWDNWTS